jgi:hypothetical protein
LKSKAQQPTKYDEGWSYQEYVTPGRDPAKPAGYTPQKQDAGWSYSDYVGATKKPEQQ